MACGAPVARPITITAPKTSQDVPRGHTKKLQRYDRFQNPSVSPNRMMMLMMVMMILAHSRPEGTRDDDADDADDT